MSSVPAPASRPQGAYDVFVSYASKDKASVLPIVAALRGLELSVFLDEDQIDGFYGDEITKAIGKSTVILFFASAESFRSVNTLTELALARDKKKNIVPVFLEQIETPDGFAFFLALAQRVQIFALERDDWIPEICKKLQAWGVTIPERPKKVIPTAAIVEQEVAVLGTSTEAYIGAAPLQPYLIDRRMQEVEIKNAFAKHHESYPVRPVVLFAHGDGEQALNEYVERFQKFTLPNVLDIDAERRLLQCH